MPALGADQHRLEIGPPATKLRGERQRGHQVPAGATARDEHGAHGVAGSVAGRPRIRPMFTRMPVATSEMTRLERPYDMNGSVSPVVGIRARDTAMCMTAVIPTMAVIPTARNCPKGSGALRAIRNPSQRKTPKSSTTSTHAQESPLLADRAEQEVGVGVGQEELLLALAETHPEEPARSDADQRLVDLHPCRVGAVAGIEEGRDPRHPVLRRLDLLVDQEQPAEPEQDEVPDLGAGGEEHHHAEQGHQGGHREIGLEKDQQ